MELQKRRIVVVKTKDGSGLVPWPHGSYTEQVGSFIYFMGPDNKQAAAFHVDRVKHWNVQEAEASDESLAGLSGLDIDSLYAHVAAFRRAYESASQEVDRLRMLCKNYGDSIAKYAEEAKQEDALQQIRRFRAEVEAEFIIPEEESKDVAHD